MTGHFWLSYSKHTFGVCHRGLYCSRAIGQQTAASGQTIGHLSLGSSLRDGSLGVAYCLSYIAKDRERTLTFALVVRGVSVTRRAAQTHAGLARWLILMTGLWSNPPTNTGASNLSVLVAS